MRKLAYVLAGFLAAVPFVLPGQAAVNVTTSPTSLVTSPVEIKASSTPLTVFKFALTADAGETLASAKVNIANAGSSVAAGTDVGSVTVYRDDGDGVFEPGVDLVAGTETTANIGSVTTVATPSNNGLPGTFFVTFATSASWSDALPKDSVTVTFTTDGIVTSANSPVVASVTTSTITADTTGPVLTGAVAKNTGGNVGLEAGDSIELTFGEATGKPVFTPAQLSATFTLTSSHSLLDGNGLFQSQSWSADGLKLILTLSSNVSLPTVVLGDTVTVQGSLITDASGNSATGNQALTGTFGTDVTGPVLTSVQAFDSAGTAGKTAGDTIVLTFGEPTNTPTVTKDNIGAVLALSNGHSFLDGSGNLGGASWNAGGTALTITLSNSTSLPTVALGDTVTVQGALIKDAANNNAAGGQTISGTFGAAADGGSTGACGNGIINGRLYRLVGDGTLYLAASCELKVFGGQAGDVSCGNKFKNIVTLSGLNGIAVRDKHKKCDCSGNDDNPGQRHSRGRGGQDDD